MRRPVSISSLPSHTSPKSIDPFRSDSQFFQPRYKKTAPPALEKAVRGTETLIQFTRMRLQCATLRGLAFEIRGKHALPRASSVNGERSSDSYLRRSNCEDLAGTFTCSPWGPKGPDNLSGYARGIDEDRTFVLKQQVEDGHMAGLSRPRVTPEGPGPSGGPRTTVRHPSLLATPSHRPYNCCRFS